MGNPVPLLLRPLAMFILKIKPDLRLEEIRHLIVQSLAVASKALEASIVRVEPYCLHKAGQRSPELNASVPFSDRLSG